MNLRYKLKTAPTTYPVSVADIKRNLRIPTTDIDIDRDTLIQDLIYDAIAASQNNTGRQYCPATYTLYLDQYPEDNEIEISLGPVTEINSIKYYQQDASEPTELNEDQWQLDNSELTARLRFLEEFYPDSQKLGVIEIEFIAGYTGSIGAQGPQASTIPYDIRQAIILRACDGYLNPENKPQENARIKAAEIKERDYKFQRY